MSDWPVRRTARLVACWPWLWLTRWIDRFSHRQQQVLPLETRDWCYGIVSRYRHIFGEKDSCRIPAEHEMERFLD